MKQIASTIIAVAIVAVSGVVHGLHTDRWGQRAEVADRAAAIDRVPMIIGDWDGRPVAIDPRVLEAAGAAGHVSRRYVNRSNGDAVSVVLLCGRPGPISVHTPDVCYQSAGRSMLGQQARKLVDYTTSNGVKRSAEFFSAEFRKQSVTTTSSMHVFWTWNAGRSWSAPDNPRLKFAAAPALYKLYVSRESAQATASPEPDLGLEFLRLLVPELDRALFPL
jgi:hypothetical protein